MGLVWIFMLKQPIPVFSFKLKRALPLVWNETFHAVWERGGFSTFTSKIQVNLAFSCLSESQLQKHRATDRHLGTFLSFYGEKGREWAYGLTALGWDLHSLAVHAALPSQQLLRRKPNAPDCPFPAVLGCSPSTTRPPCRPHGNICTTYSPTSSNPCPCAKAMPQHSPLCLQDRPQQAVEHSTLLPARLIYKGSWLPEEGDALAQPVMDVQDSCSRAGGIP